jgi:Serine/threonine protein phosphatase
MSLQYVAESKIGLKRICNEDTVGVFDVDQGLLVVVCDGIGGKKAGDVASNLAVDAVFNYFSNSAENDYLKKIEQALNFANQSIRENAKSNSAFSGMATTAEVLFIKSDYAYWGHVGDSRIYFLGSDGLYCITKDHSLVQKLVDEGYITKEQAEKHPQRNVIMRAVGDENELEIDVDKLKLNYNNSWKFLVCTDGVSSVLSENDLSGILYNNSINKIADKIIDLVEFKGAPDNFSFVIISNGN